MRIVRRGAVAEHLGINRVLFHERHEEDDRAERTASGLLAAVVDVAALAEHRAGRRKGVVRIVIVLDSQTNLLEIVGALHTASGFTRSLNGGEKQTDEDTNDRDNDEEFNKGKTLSRERTFHGETP